jgi:DNA/RNA endonuclease YhcR with UshA esterase domain
MKTVIALIVALGMSSLVTVGQATNAAAGGSLSLARISAAEAERHFAETVIVTGKVAQVSIRPKLTYLNLDKAYPQTPMSCVVFARARNQFGDLKLLEGKDIEVRGKIEEYQAKAQIILNSSNQLRVIEKATGPGDSRKK